MGGLYLASGAATLTQLGVVLIVVLGWGRLETPRRLIGSGMVVAFASDVAMFVTGRLGLPNRSIWLVTVPIVTVLLGLGFRAWLSGRVERMGMLATTVLFVMGWVGVMASSGNPARIDTVVTPVHAVMLISGAAWVLLSRVAGTRVPIIDQPWFWISVGLMWNNGVLAILTPLTEFYASEPNVVLTLFVANSAKDILGYVLIGRGLWMQAVPKASTGSIYSLGSSRSSSPER